MGLIAAAVTGVIGFFIRRSRIRSALLADIELNLSGVTEARAYVVKLFDVHVREGIELKFYGSFHVGKYHLYESLQADLARYLDKDRLLKVIRVYHTFWELEISLKNLMDLMKTWTKEERILTQEDVERLKAAKERQFRLIDILTAKEIRKLRDLPSDYRDRLPPVNLLETLPQSKR